MNFDLYNIGILIAVSIYFILPAYLSNSSALIFGGGTPLDFDKKTKDGMELIGPGCTWRGLIAGTIIGGIVGALQGAYTPLLKQACGNIIPFITYSGITNGLFIGLILGFGALLGDAIGSFIKRRLGIPRGHSAPILDQIDFAVVALILVSFFIHLTIEIVITVLIITIFIHLIANTIAYLIGAKDVWY